jgi:hypothetical protein
MSIKARYVSFFFLFYHIDPRLPHIGIRKLLHNCN